MLRRERKDELFTPPKFNSSPLKNGGKGRQSFPIGVEGNFSGAFAVKLPGGFHTQIFQCIYMYRTNFWSYLILTKVILTQILLVYKTRRIYGTIVYLPTNLPHKIQPFMDR